MDGVSVVVVTELVSTCVDSLKQRHCGRDEGVVTTRTQSNEFRVVTSSNEYLSPRNIVTEYLSSND